MASALRKCALLALLGLASTLPNVADGRLVMPTSLQLQAVPQRLAAQQAASHSLETRVGSYYAGSGFPKAGRSLPQMVAEADAFLRTEIPTSGAVGVGVSIVYGDQVVLSKGYGLRQSNDSASAVTKDSIFQIGSVSKTFIALAIGLLVEEGKMQWKDRVQSHLPWFRLFDKYAEKYVRIGDLLSMNSGLGRMPDLPLFVGGYETPRAFVEALEYCEPDHALRETPAYANANYEILGQIIGEVSGQPWDDFVTKRLIKPLGLTHTFASVYDVPTPMKASFLNSGHLTCQGQTRGPFDFERGSMVDLSPTSPYLAAGSIVSSAADMAQLARVLLNRGRVGNVTLFKSPATIAEMVTGKNLAMDEFFALNGTAFELTGLRFPRDGGTLAAGYGFDIVGDVAWGHAYFDKGGDTFVHHTSTGFVPGHDLGVVLLANSDGVATAVNQYRTYVVGIFLDVPKDVLDFELARWRATYQDLVSKRKPLFPGAPLCGLPFWKDLPRPALAIGDLEGLVGEYTASISSDFFPHAVISRGAAGGNLKLQLGATSLTLVYVGSQNSARTFVAQGDGSRVVSLVTAVPDDHVAGRFVLDMGGLGYKRV